MSFVGAEEEYAPRPLGELLRNFLSSSNEPLAVAYRERKNRNYSDNLTLTQIKNMKFPGVTNKTIMEVVNNYGLFTEKYDKVIYSAIDFISKGSYIQIQSDCNRIAIGLQSDSFPTHTRDDKDIKIKIKDNHIDAVDDDNSTEMASLEPPSEDMRKEDNSSDVADMKASEKEGACILERFLSIRCVGSSLVARGDKRSLFTTRTAGATIHVL